MKRALICLAAAALFSSCAVRAVEGGTKPATQTGFFWIKKDDFKVDGEKVFKDARKVVIGSFKVGFVTGKYAKRKAGRGPGGVAAADVTLIGPDDALYAKLADAAYQDFLQQLEKAGYEVAPRQQLLTHKSFAEVKTHPAPYKDDGLMLVPGGEVSYFVPRDFDNKIHFFAQDAAVVWSAGWGSSNPNVGATAFADETKLPVLSVNYLLDFVNDEGGGGAWSSTSNVTVGQGISVKIGSSLTLIRDGGGFLRPGTGSIQLGQAIYSEEAFGTIKDTTTTADKSLQVASNVVTTALGAGSSVRRNFDITAEAGKYESVAAKVLAEANAKLIEQMKSRR
ncbi:MAG: hypothetical protein RL095_1274 [Verrucomicrobiota bacterium]|jgi:hypothetical protein